MSEESKILLIFDLKAILASSTRDWTLFEQIGTCFIPQIVMEEIEFLCQRAVTPEEEKTAREFVRFISNSNWQINKLLTKHSALKASDGQNLSKNARLQQAIAESVSGLAQANTEQLVVLVSNQQNLRNDLDNLAIDNLCTLTLAQLIQWLRTKQKPINVSQKIVKIANEGVSFNEFKTTNSVSSSSINSQKTPSQKLANTNSNYPQTKAKVKQKSTLIPNLFSSISALVGFSFLGLMLWYFIQPHSFNQFWQKTGLPILIDNNQ